MCSSDLKYKEGLLLRYLHILFFQFCVLLSSFVHGVQEDICDVKTDYFDTREKLSAANYGVAILELESITVSDVMLPRKKVDAVDLNLPVNEILKTIAQCQHRKIIAYRGDVDHIVGVLNVHRVLGFSSHREYTSKADILKLVQEAYFIPQTATLQTQLLKFL